MINTYKVDDPRNRVKLQAGYFFQTLSRFIMIKKKKNNSDGPSSLSRRREDASFHIYLENI